MPSNRARIPSHLLNRGKDLKDGCKLHMSGACPHTQCCRKSHYVESTVRERERGREKNVERENEACLNKTFRTLSRNLTVEQPFCLFFPRITISLGSEINWMQISLRLDRQQWNLGNDGSYDVFGRVALTAIIYLDELLTWTTFDGEQQSKRRTSEGTCGVLWGRRPRN